MISKRHWLIAGAAALSMHAVGFYAVFHHAPEGSKGAGAQGIEFDLGMMGDMGAAAQTTLAQQENVTPKKAEEKPLEKKPQDNPPPKVKEKPPKPVEKKKPTPVEKKPEPIKETTPEPVKKPVIKPAPPVVAKQTSPVVVPKVTPKPKVEPKPKPVAKVEPTPKPTPKVETQPETKPTLENAPSQNTQVASATPQKQGPKSQASQKATTGSSNAVTTGGNPGAKAKYFTQLTTALAQNKRYPRASRRRNEEGVVTLAFTAYANGSVSDAKIVKSSGYRRLDKAVLTMLKRAVPLPKFSDDMPEKQLSITLPVSFKLSDY
ncbi:MAG: energy transducer TonB [Marinomonas sp.]|jgi:protein TonB